MKVGLIGLGVMGRSHAGRYIQMPDVEIAAVADAMPERLNAGLSIQGNLDEQGGGLFVDRAERYADGRDLIDRADVDVIDICLPTFLHAEFAVRALEKGRHVLCEKPMALTTDESDRMIATARQANRLLMVAQCIRFWPEYLFLRRQVEQGTWGKLLSLDMYRLGGQPRWSWQDWFRDPARSGGPILDLHLHDLDFVHAMLGRPDSIQATARTSPVTGGYDVIHALFNYNDGPQVHMHGGWSHAQIKFRAGFEAWFEHGVLCYDGRNNPPLQIFDHMERAEGRPASYEPGDAYYNEMTYFLDCVRQHIPPTECLPESTRDSLMLIDLEIQAIQSGETIQIPPR